MEKDRLSELPPLNPLWIFAVVGLHGRFNEAAMELGVTPGAVSRQIRVLEQHLGVKLFRRTASGVQLTATAQAYHREVVAAFERLSTGTNRLLATEANRRIRVRTPSCFLNLWLLPRMASFNARHPQIEVMFADRGRKTDLAQYDLAVDCAYEVPQHCVLQLFDVRMVPVCSPRYLHRHGPLATPQDLAAQPLLTNKVHQAEWLAWFRQENFSVEHPRWMKFADTYSAYQAALSGVGIALGRRNLIERDVARGDLVILSENAYQPGRQYFLVRDPSVDFAHASNFRTFSDWLQRKFEREGQVSS